MMFNRDNDRIKNMLSRIYINSESESFLDTLINNLDDTEVVVFNYPNEPKLGTIITGMELKRMCKQLKTK